MSRRESRENSLKFLFQMEFHDGDFPEMKETFIKENGIKEKELDYFNSLSEGVASRKTELDDIYSAYLKNWNLERIPKVDQTILRIATYEIMYEPDVPFNVSVSEAVIMAKKYSTEESRSFINGVLKNLESMKNDCMGRKNQ